MLAVFAVFCTPVVSLCASVDVVPWDVCPQQQQLSLSYLSAQCDFEDKNSKDGSLKKIVDEAVKAKASFTDKEVRGAVRKMFAEKYAGQATSKVSDKKATGLTYFYAKLRF